MEGQAVVEPLAGEVEEVEAGERRLRAGEPHRDRPPLGADLDRARLAGALHDLRGRSRASCPLSAGSSGGTGRPSLPRLSPASPPQHVGPAPGQLLEQGDGVSPLQRLPFGPRGHGAHRGEPRLLRRVLVDAGQGGAEVAERQRPDAPPASRTRCRARSASGSASALRATSAALGSAVQPGGEGGGAHPRAGVAGQPLERRGARRRQAELPGRLGGAGAQGVVLLGRRPRSTSSSGPRVLAGAARATRAVPRSQVSPAAAARRQDLAELGRSPDPRRVDGAHPHAGPGIVEQRAQPRGPVGDRLRLAAGDQRLGRAQGLDRRVPDRRDRRRRAAGGAAPGRRRPPTIPSARAAQARTRGCGIGQELAQGGEGLPARARAHRA